MLTPEQLAYIRTYLGEFSCEFTNEQLDQFEKDAAFEGATDLTYGVLAQAYFVLASGAIGLTNFRQGETVENDAVIYNRLWDMYSRFAAKAGIPQSLPRFSMTQIPLKYIEFEDNVDDAP